MPVHLYQFPAANSKNALFELLHRAFARTYPDIQIEKVSGDAPYKLLFSSALKTDGTRVIHIHWPTVLYGSKYVLKSLALLFLNITVINILRRLWDFRIVWTIHNAYAHDYPHRWIDALGQALLAHSADAIVVQQRSLVHVYQARYPHTLVRYIPHGNYCGWYPPIDAVRADFFRTKYSLKSNDIVLLSLGAVRPYKKIEEIMDAYTNATAQRSDDRLKLIIAGSCDKTYEAQLRAKTIGIKNIYLDSAFVADADIASLLSIADYSVFFYDDSEITSGGMLLSLSYGVPVIMRDIPAAEIIKPGANGEVFSDIKSLTDILTTLNPATYEEKKEAVLSVEKDDWEKSALLLHELYTCIIPLHESVAGR